MTTFVGSEGMLAASAWQRQTARPSPQGDHEWASFEQSGVDVTNLFARPVRGSIRAEDLFRNVLLNRADAYIDPAVRELIRIRVREFEAVKSAFAEYRVSATAAEMDDLMERGVARVATLPSRTNEAGEVEHYLDLRAVFGGRVPPIRRLQAGKVYYAYLDQLPLTREAHDLYEFAMTQFVTDLTSLFVSMGCCNERDARVLIERTLEQLRASMKTWSGPRKAQD